MQFDLAVINAAFQSVASKLQAGNLATTNAASSRTTATTAIDKYNDLLASATAANADAVAELDAAIAVLTEMRNAAAAGVMPQPITNPDAEPVVTEATNRRPGRR